MKTFIKNNTPFIVLVFSTLFLFSSCKLDDNYTYTEVSGVAAVNAIPGTKKVSIALDQNRLNSNWNEHFNYTDFLYYRKAYPGTRQVSVYASNSIANDGERQWLKQQVTLKPGLFYSLFVVGKDSTDAEILLTEDNFSTKNNRVAQVRFMNLSPDEEAISFTVSKLDSLNFINKKFKAYQPFKEYATGEVYKITLSSGTLKKEFDFKPVSGKVYTIWAKGLKDATDEANSFGYQITAY